MVQQKAPEQAAKFLSYVLGRRPDEFGLVPDYDGYIKIKELLKAVSEEDGWRHIRKSHIDEIMVTLPNPPFEIRDNLIRAKDREHLRLPAPAKERLPGLLYTCVSKKAHPVILEKGILPSSYSHVILSSDRNMAEKIGKRYDPSPVLITVHVQKSEKKGVVFLQAGEILFLAESVPADCFTAPPLPKEKPEVKKPEPMKERMSPNYFPGSFFMNFEKEEEQKRLKEGKKKDKIEREKDRKRARKEKKKWQDN